MELTELAHTVHVESTQTVIKNRTSRIASRNMAVKCKDDVY